MINQYELLLWGYYGHHRAPIPGIIQLIRSFQSGFKYADYGNSALLLTPNVKREFDIDKIADKYTNKKEIVRIINKEMRGFYMD